MQTEYEKKKLMINNVIYGEKIWLRLVTLNDCNETYLRWLQDDDVTCFLETRWIQQTLKSINEFVSNMMCDEHSYLFAIIENKTGQHIGNIKLGPNNPYHNYSELSYFIGEKSAWGRGFATEAIRLVCLFGLNVLNLRWIYAGVYGQNIASQRALEKEGFLRQAIFHQRLRSGDIYDDHLWYGLSNIDKVSTHTRI